MSETGITVSGTINSIAGRQYWYGWSRYFSILLAIAILLAAASMQDWVHDLATSAKLVGYNDPSTFASAAIDVTQNGWVIESSRWIFNLWPPGFVLLEAGLLKLFGNNAPMPLLLLVISSGLFATVMMEMRRILVDSFGQWAWPVPLLIFCFSEARIFLLSPVGLLFGEWLAIGCFLWAVLLLKRANLKAAMFAGILFAISAYTRSQFELFLDVILLISVGLIVASRYFNKPRNFNGWQAGKFLLISMLVAQALMLPWRLYHFQEGNGLRWVSTGAVIIQNGLMSDSALKEKGGDFIILGGGNVACHIAPEHCGETDPRAYFDIFLEHPFAWIKEKVQLLPKYWYAPVSVFTYPSSSPDLLDVALQSILLICLLLAGLLLWFIRKSAEACMWTAIALGLLIAHFFIIAFAQLEVRYFFFIKIYSVFLLIILLGSIVQLRRQKINQMSGEIDNSKGVGENK